MFHVLTPDVARQKCIYTCAFCSQHLILSRDTLCYLYGQIWSSNDAVIAGQCKYIVLIRTSRSFLTDTAKKAREQSYSSGMKYLCLSASETDSLPLLRPLRLQTSLHARSQPAFRRLSSRVKSYLEPYSFLQAIDVLP